MITQQLEALRPARQAQNFESFLKLRQRMLRRSMRRTARLIAAQYYLTDAYVDSRRAFSLNEDIALATVLVIGVLSFSTISILANALYMFVLTANAFAAVAGVDFALLMIVAFAVCGVIIAWLAAFLQNALSIALMDGLIRKQNRSLITTFRRALHSTSKTTLAWFLLALATGMPVAIGVSLLAGGLRMAHVPVYAAIPYLVAAGSVASCWMLVILANYSLLPYVALFEPINSWKDSFRRSRKLVTRKGRLFILSGYAVLGGCLLASYVCARMIQTVTHFNATLLFMMLSTIVFSVANGIMTAFYRKRRLARK
ncbi:MAG: hypothetical protein NVS1B7_4940 [Candidatus Saccharimonadales bacterium]